MSRHFLAHRTRGFFATALIACTLTVPSPTRAQDTATLSGSLKDAIGASIPNATIVLRNDATKFVRNLHGDSVGHFSVSGIPAGTYTVEASAPGFALTTRQGVVLNGSGTQDVALTLKVGGANEQVTVDASMANSIAASYAVMDGVLDARSARTEINSTYIQNYVSPTADYTEVLQNAPGTYSLNANGVGLGDAKMFFRGFSDGNYDITFDGIPWNDTNSPSHHSWAFFPSQFLGGVDFDRSPGSASTVGPTPFGGSINLLSKEMPDVRNLRGGISYGSFNTKLIDVNYDTGNFGGASKHNNLFVDVHHMDSDGYQTFNYQTRNAGALKYQFKFSENKVLTGFASVLWLDSNTPNIKGPTRAQVAQFGDNYLLQNTDPTQANYYKYNFYHVPTDFEYVGYKQQLGHGWSLDTKPYTYSYNNKQNYAATPKKGTVSEPNCATPVSNALPCGTDKLNSYRKYGEITSLSQVSRFGIFRVGMWYEWAATDRYQIPQDPITQIDSALPNFHEKFWTNTYQPYAEYEYHATNKLTLTGGLKFAHYTMDLKQYADNGSTVGNLNGAAYVRNYASYNSVLPSVDANYRIRPNWSVYGQFATGSVIPPSSVFDINQSTGAAVLSTLPKPSYAKSYQTGTVLKLRRLTTSADVYYVRFGNAYSAPSDPNAVNYTSQGDSVTKGFEGETNVYLGKGLSLFANGTAGTAKYVSQLVGGSPNLNYNLWVASTPANTESLGLTYQDKYLNLGMFNKRIGPMWNDGKYASSANPILGTNANQAVPIDPFNVTNMYVNFTVRRGSIFDQTKIRFSVNNLLNQHNITSVNPAGSVPLNRANYSFTPASGDTLGLLPGRSFMVSFTIGLSPRQ
ncbi:TonB-dependent receptor [Terriglobus tenax]|uniref:TonB-dependent receptor n=1 Tax=Terriglobus tenax TaxID=1111115 RepID=UPI0021DF9B65|nr:TonB-dependent receptor [Terriglobus tenax]